MPEFAYPFAPGADEKGRLSRLLDTLTSKTLFDNLAGAFELGFCDFSDISDMFVLYVIDPGDSKSRQGWKVRRGHVN